MIKTEERLPLDEERTLVRTLDLVELFAITTDLEIYNAFVGWLVQPMLGNLFAFLSSLPFDWCRSLSSGMSTF